jgi:predicted Fe-S protein YdhL (DUF1289 family)
MQREPLAALKSDKHVVNLGNGRMVSGGACEGVRPDSCVNSSRAIEMVGFWLEGYDARRKSIQQELEKRLAELQERLANASSSDEKREIKATIREERAAHKRKLAQLDRSLY